MEGATVGAQKDAKGDTCPAVVVDACMTVEAVLVKSTFANMDSNVSIDSPLDSIFQDRHILLDSLHA